ncbi:DNA-processing protein DprA [Candidatus Trichorickettsia mobilis]|uniref:DNA-processing protein DprA n=1 Tax=Candidatus Trichorickettsia mobilis TaxID=1346319 RepID=UPI00292F1F6E|nr:DNA-processing protein DprA [Candidatus Trichorickettsia mobilis]
MLKELLLGKKSHTYTSEIIDILRLIRSENVGSRTFLALLNLFGNATSALENIAEFSVRGGRFKPIKVCSYDDAIKELDLLDKFGAKIISYKCAQYSKLLREIPDLPPILCYKGNIELFAAPLTIAIVGARNASANGQFFAGKLASELIQQGYVIVSGFARGIDTAAHKASPAKTIAVMAGGIDYVYPPENQKLYDTIADVGLIIAELPIGAKPLSQHFPQRNRLISGLSLGTVVVEATIKSGSLITTRFALEQNREVFAVPGFPLDPRSSGTNKLIKDGAHLTESAQDIIANINVPDYEKLMTPLEDLQRYDNNYKPVDHKYLNQIDDSMRKTIMNLLSSTPIEFETIVEAAKMPLPVIYTIILELELAGSIIRSPGNKFCLAYK